MSNVYFFNELKQFVTFPKILITITLFLASFFVAPFLSNINQYFIMFITGVFINAYLVYMFKKNRKIQMMKVLLIDTVMPGGIRMFFLAGAFWSMTCAELLPQSPGSPSFFAFLVILNIIVQVGLGNFYEKMAERAEKHYPAAFS